MTACTVLKCTGNISTGLTLTTHVGDTAFIPCSVPLASSLTIVWEINGVTYNIDSLQSRNLVRISSGLLINDVSDNNDGEYTCYSHDTMANNLQQLYVVHLTVLPSKGDDLPQLFIVLHIIIYIYTNTCMHDNYMYNKYV